MNCAFLYPVFSAHFYGTSSENLTVSGDGTAVHTHANPRGHRLNPDPDKPYNPDVPRHFSDPDASWGWDSDMEKYYYGYPLFQLSCHNHSLHVDIPLLLRFTSAKRHDSVSFLVAFHEFEKHETTLRTIRRHHSWGLLTPTSFKKVRCFIIL